MIVLTLIPRSGDSADVLEERLTLNKSSAGARPKALIGVDDRKV